MKLGSLLILRFLVNKVPDVFVFMSHLILCRKMTKLPGREHIVVTTETVMIAVKKVHCCVTIVSLVAAAAGNGNWTRAGYHGSQSADVR